MGIQTSIIKFKQSMDGLTGSTWKNKSVIKRQVGPRSGPASAAQLANQRKFTLLVALSRILATAYSFGFKNLVAARTLYNVFVSENYPFTSDNGTVASITVADIVVAKGPILGVEDVAAATGSSAGEVDITWEDNSNGSTGLATDLMYLAVLNNDQDIAFFAPTSATRADGAYTATGLVAGGTYHFYPFFIKADLSQVSDNSYDSAAAGS